jgi:hypothetical protein
MAHLLSHACTPARLLCTPLGSAPAGTLPHTLAALTLNASSLVSSLFVEGKSGIVDLCSQIVDLTSPNAKRQTIRPWLTLVAPIHNQNASLLSAKLSNECSQTAPQAASRPIHENAPCENGLIDCMGSSSNLQKRLLDALKGIPCSLSPPHSPTIHNFWLCIALQERSLAAPVQQARQSRQATQANSNQASQPYPSCPKRGNADGLARQLEFPAMLLTGLTPTSVNRACSNTWMGFSALLQKTRRGASEVTRSPLNTLFASLIPLAWLPALSHRKGVQHG